MAHPKKERNKLLLELVAKGHTYQQVFEELRKEGYTGLKDYKSVGMQLSRLRKRKKAAPSKPATQQPGRLSKVETEGIRDVEEASGGLVKFKVVRKPAKQQAGKLAEYKKVTYYLDPAMAKDIKRLALERDKDISELVREIFRSYLKGG